MNYEYERPQFSIDELGQLVAATHSKPAADVLVENHGSIYLFRPLTAVARVWIDENVVSEGWQWLGNALAVEHRLIADLVAGAQAEGLVVE